MRHTHIEYLNELLANFFVLYVKFHRYHWYIEGKHFFELHNVFEEMYTYCGETKDVLAERIRMIEGRPLATMAAFLRESTIEEATSDDTEEEITSQLIEDLKEVCSSIEKKGIPRATEANDEPTIDLLVSIQYTFEKKIWMFEAFRE